MEKEEVSKRIENLLEDLQLVRIQFAEEARQMDAMSHELRYSDGHSILGDLISTESKLLLAWTALNT